MEPIDIKQPVQQTLHVGDYGKGDAYVSQKCAMDGKYYGINIDKASIPALIDALNKVMEAK